MKLVDYFDDLKIFLSKNKRRLILFCCFIMLGLIIGFIFILNSNSYLLLLKSEDKILLDYIAGLVNFGKQITRFMFKVLGILLVIFALNFNFYLGRLSYLIVSYQSMILCLSTAAICTQFGIKGLLITLTIIVPINIIVLALVVLFALVCCNRSELAMKSKDFCFDFNNRFFWINLAVILLVLFVVAVAVCVILFLIFRFGLFILF